MSRRIGYPFYYGTFFGAFCSMTGIAAHYHNWIMFALAAGIAVLIYLSFLSRLYGSSENSERVGSDY